MSRKRTPFLATAVAALAAWVASSPVFGAAAALAVAPVVADEGAATVSYDGVVEALRQSALSSQVSGTVVAVLVAAGERVKAGQVLVRLDARAAEQQAAAATAQLQAARASDDAATREFERQQQLYQKHYISQAALDRAEAQYKAARAQSAAQLQAAAAARTESDYYSIRAPYAGVVSSVPAVQGDMAMPGRPLLTIYDPAALRVSASMPQTAAPSPTGTPLAELAGERITPTRWQVLPAADAATHTVHVRLELPAGTAAVPGMFARVWLTGAPAAAPRLWVPATAVFKRAELTGVYVIAADGRPSLRQVRLGTPDGDRVEILAGVARGERVALDPQGAAKVR